MLSGVAIAESDAVISEGTVFKRVYFRIIPILIAAYLVAYLDRVNIGFAKLQMAGDLKFDDAVYGLGAGVFFLGYFLFEVPSNLILRRVGARRWISRIMITWGLVSACMIFVETPVQFYIVRFLLGLAEAGFSPGILFFLTMWFPARHRGRATGLFLVGGPLSYILGGPLSGWILSEFGNEHLFKAWQWLFLIEAAPALLMGLVILRYLDDSVRGAKWLSEPEKRMIEAALRAENADKTEHGSIRKFLAYPGLWLMCFICFCFIMGMYGLAFWLPSLIKRSGIQDPFTIGLYSAVPYVFAACGIILSGISADRTGLRRLHFVGAMFIGAIGLSASMLVQGNPLLTVLCLSVAAFGALPATTLFWALPTGLLTGVSVAAGLAVVNSVGNLAGFFGPYVVGWLNVASGREDLGMYLISGFLVVGGLVAFKLPAALIDR